MRSFDVATPKVRDGINIVKGCNGFDWGSSRLIAIAIGSEGCCRWRLLVATVVVGGMAHVSTIEIEMSSRDGSSVGQQYSNNRERWRKGA